MGEVIECTEYEVFDFDEVVGAKEWRNAYNILMSKINSLPKYQKQHLYLILKRYTKGERTPELYNSMIKE